MTRLHIGTGGKFYRSQRVRREGTSLVFDEGRPEEVDPVDEICQWALKNLDAGQIEKLCKGLSLSQRSASLEGMDGEEGVTGYPGGRQAGPGKAGPYKTAMDAGLRQLAYSVKKDADLRDEFSFDKLFNPHASGSDSSRDDVSLDSIFGGGGDADEVRPSFDHLGSRAPLWVNVR
jgi:hypothetical protein